MSAHRSQTDPSRARNAARWSLPAATVVFVVAFNGLIDLPRIVGVGPVSGLGIFTVLLVGWLGLVLAAAARAPRTAARATSPFAAFMVWAIVSVVWSEPTIEGGQNLAVFAASFGLIVVGSIASHRDSLLPDKVGRVLTASAMLATIVFGCNLLLGTNLGPRSVALFMLMAHAWFLASWQSGSSRSLVLALGSALFIGATLSRLAFVTSLVMFPLSQLGRANLRRLAMSASWALIMGAVFLAAIRLIEPLRARFFEGDLSLQVGGLQINATGRIAFWTATVSSLLESPWVGKGAGSAQALIEATFPGLGHPHNDYLRLLHDYGVVGLSLWLWGFLNLFIVSWAALVRSARSGGDARAHLAALLASFAVACAMLTDNTVVFIFVMAPWAILQSLSLGSSGRSTPLRGRATALASQLTDSG